jgi:hypothetical protein
MERNLSSQVTNWREARRFRAWELYQMGWKQKDIAVAMGVTKGGGQPMAETSQGRRY